MYHKIVSAITIYKLPVLQTAILSFAYDVLPIFKLDDMRLENYSVRYCCPHVYMCMLSL